jgi:hypothetical protein
MALSTIRMRGLPGSILDPPVNKSTVSACVADGRRAGGHADGSERLYNPSHPARSRLAHNRERPEMQRRTTGAPESDATPAESKCRRRRKAIVLRLVLWGIAAYLVAPRLWTRYLQRAKPLPDVSRVTHTSDGHRGDPVNIALESGKEDVIKAMTAAGWYPADPVILSSSLKIAIDTVLRRVDDMAPVSPLFLFGRQQDLAFEQPVPGGPRHRHHVR